MPLMVAPVESVAPDPPAPVELLAPAEAPPPTDPLPPELCACAMVAVKDNIAATKNDFLMFTLLIESGINCAAQGRFPRAMVPLSSHQEH